MQIRQAILSSLALAVYCVLGALPGLGDTAPVAVGAQYDSTHVYVSPQDVDRFVSSFIATFGGTASKTIALTVTPTPSTTEWRFITSPVGTLSVFGFTTPIPYPFGSERTGYLVTDMDAALQAAAADGADVIVTPFPDAVGRDAIVEWPGGLRMQLYWHTVAPSYPALATVPENRVYLSPSSASSFLRSFLAFSHGTVTSDEGRAPGIEIGEPTQTFRRIRIESSFGKMEALVTNGHLPYPYGRELMGYEVGDLDATLARARTSGVTVLDGPYDSDDRRAAIVTFPGGYIAEIHSARPHS
ncbi:MAG TPA: hypothetical protein VFE16_08520 [Candidatus Cybelea sp.]|jgi:predicted enzyme related to lactoylglutathione lyase|nr:hypothetical protein [Candidatus Cybelea sp.]